jgi:GT2 family glycosyltransferase
LSESGKRSESLYQNSTGILTPVIAFGENLNKKTMNGCGLLIPRRVFDSVGLFDTKYKHLLDRELWMRIASFGYTFAYADELLVISRAHNSQITVKAQESLYNEEAIMIEQYYGNLLQGKIEPLMGLELCYFAYKRMHYKQGKELYRYIKASGILSIKAYCMMVKYELFKIVIITLVIY